METWKMTVYFENLNEKPEIHYFNKTDPDWLKFILAITVAKTKGIKVEGEKKYIVFVDNITYIAERIE